MRGVLRERRAALGYAVRGRVAGKYLGQLGLTLAALTCVPLAVAAATGEAAFAWRLGLMTVLLAAVCTPLARLAPPEHVREAEALMVAALAFVLAAVLMSWPFMAVGLSFADALFEAVSGVTTTGLTTVADPAAHPFAFQFARAWLQWYGGLGIVVLSVALLMGHQAAARRLAEPFGGETLAAATRTHARRMLIVYAALTGAGFLALWAAGLPPGPAAVHVLAAVSTGGFTPHADSLAGLAAAPRALLSGLSLAGAVSLPLYWSAATGGARRPAGDPELRALLALWLLWAVLLAGLLHVQGGLPWGAAWGHGLALGASAQSTTGFATLAPAALPPAAVALLLPAMAMGGSVGSTAGGVKLLRVLFLAALLRAALRRAVAPPHAVVETRLAGQPVAAADAARAVTLMALFALVAGVSWLPFVAAGHDPLHALFEVVSATATTGLSTGITSAGLSPGLKAVLCADMLLGRVEIVALLVLLYPPVWLGRRG